MSNLCTFAVMKYLSGVGCVLDDGSIANDATVEGEMLSDCHKKAVHTPVRHHILHRQNLAHPVDISPPAVTYTN